MALEPFDKLFSELESTQAKGDAEAVREMLTDHFWCTLFLALAVVVDEF